MALLTRLSSILLLALLVCYIDLGEASKDVPVARAEDTHLSQDAINALWENWHPSRERMDLIQNETNSAPSDLRARDDTGLTTYDELETTMCKSPGTIGFYRRFLWSGWNTNDCSTYDKSKSTEYPAGNLSKAIGSTTLESTLEKANLKMPGWNDNDEEGKKLWKYASMRYAQCASDYIVFFKGKCVREDNVFVTIEFPTIRAGAGVNCIFQVTSADRRNPTTYWVRNGHEDDCKGALADLECELGQISDAEMAAIPN